MNSPVQPGISSAATGVRDGLTLAQWLDAVAHLLGDYDNGAALVAETGVCCWMDYFNGDYSPGEAVAEEYSYD